ncbi:MAG: hypothetical protein IIC71_02785 [Acidobacteria bacterium]|nr:hypothetical protein [Acidobacteriota bacterium]
MGASEPIEDGIDDFEDPSTSDAAESGSGEAAMDIASFRYLGTENGVARFEITTRGNACEIFRELVPLAQLSIAVTTPDGGRYFIGYRLSDGTETTFASSEGAILDGVTVSLEEWVNESTAILAVTGVDVPVGSTLLAGTWLIRDDASSGFQDFAEGTATPVTISDDEEPVASELEEPVVTEQDPEEQQEASTATPSTTTDDDTGSFPIWIPLVVLGAAVGGYFIYRNTQTRVTTTQTTDARDITDADLEQYRDGDLSSYTDVYAPATTMTTSFDEDWTALLAIEDEIQKRYMDDLKSLLTEVVAKYNAFHTAITLFKEKFVKIASGSTGLQGYLQRWFDVRKTAQEQDLAFGIITLVWGAGSLGLKGVRWLRAPKAATSVETGAARVLGSADELATGETVLAEGATVIDGGRRAKGLDKVYDAYAAEVGIDGEAWIERFAGDFPRAQQALIEIVARSRGWHGITDEASSLLNRLLVNGRSAVVGGPGTINPGDVAKLREWVSTGGFWDRLLTAGGMVDDGAVLFYNVDDVKFLKALLSCEGNLSSLKPLLGPAQGTALGVAAEVAGEIPGFAGVASGAVGTAIDSFGTSGTLGSMLWGPGPISGLDLSGYTDQFGGWASAVDEGFGSAILSGVWGLFTSPFETFDGIVMTAGAIDRYTEFLQSNGADLVELSGALNDALGALDGLRGAIERADLGSAKSSLGGTSALKLENLMSDMDDLLDGASDDWKARNGDAVKERKEHIAQKIADVERILDALQSQLGRLAQMHSWLDGLRTNRDGSLRSATALWNPELLVRLGSVDLALKGIIGSALLGGSQPNPPSAPPAEQPNVPDPFADDYQPFAEFDAESEPTSEEIQEELDEVFGDWDLGNDE